MSVQSVSSARPLSAATGRSLVLAFSATLFLSAFLLFSVQPLFTRMILPKLGGSPAVWSVAMVFFQGVLLLGYGYAHFLTRRFGPVKGAGLHLAVMLVAVIALPIAVAPGWTRPPETGQAFWLLGAFGVSVGLPFFAVSANGPLLQAWFARSGHPHASDPYFLYGASNIGSLLALLSYPVLVEPQLTLSAQSAGWAVGYGLLVAAIAGVALMAQKNAKSAETVVEAESPATPVTWRQRLGWTGLAFVPSALLVAVTAHLSTDVAAAPFLWVLPLSLFLLTFVITFQRRPIIDHSWMLGLQPLVAGGALSVLALGYALSLEFFFVLDLAVLFVVAMVCHGELVRRRPHADDLTGFYLWMSFGGVLGGIFSGLIAPQVFSTVLEYPLLVAASFLARPAVFASGGWRKAGLAAAVTAIVALAALSVVRAGGVEDKANLVLLQVVQIVLIAALLISHRSPKRLAAVAVTFLAMAVIVAPVAKTETSYRGFFGVHKIRDAADGSYRLLMHGTTIHGVQRLVHDAKGTHFDPEPLAYYYWDSPLAEAVKAARGAGRIDNAALVGLGAGALACHAQAGEAFRVFEIDPLVVKIASDPARFGFLSNCPPKGGIVVGDARLTLADEDDRRFGLIVLDAFSSDSIPVHLLTVEAMTLYMSKLDDTGLLAFHVSNRNMILQPVVAAAARDLGLEAYYRHHPPVKGDPLKYGSEVVVVGRKGGAVDTFADRSEWRHLSATVTARAWTDDYSNVLGAVLAQLRAAKPDSL